MSLFTAQLHPGRALGFLTLGAYLHDVLTRLKAEPQTFPKLQILYSRDQPVSEPVCVVLPSNGMRLRFDGPEQRLRLIEVTDFTKSHITFKERDLLRPTTGSGSPGAEEAPASGPTFRHIYHRLLGPTYAGEYITGSSADKGIYVLSYPGVAFNFALSAAMYSADKDVVSLLSASASQMATSMAVFSGASWAEARPTLWTEALPSIKTTATLPRGKDVFPDDISLIRLHGGGKIQLFRKWTSASFWIVLGETTAQDLVAELGPPSAIYRKNDQKMVIHKLGRKNKSNNNGTNNGSNNGRARADQLTDTDQSSMHTGSDDDDDDDDDDEESGDADYEAAGGMDDRQGLSGSGECFYNYFYLGFDVLLSTYVAPSVVPPGETHVPDGIGKGITVHDPQRLVATKLVLHGNIPGSYEFNRHRRCRWEICYLDDDSHELGPIHSEMQFRIIEGLMNKKWKGVLGGGAAEGGRGGEAPGASTQPRSGGMVLNRGWGDSPGSSCELLGGWEESGSKRPEATGDSTTTLYGFPGMVFEVLKNDYVNALTVF